MRKTISHIRNHKTCNQPAGSPAAAPLACLTAYTAPLARVLDRHCDLLLVGDSVAMVLYGEPSTLQADMEMMIRHGRAVVNATQNALVVVDMPFGSYQESREAAFRNAARILKETGAGAVKMEGGAEMEDTIAYLSARGVPVMGHIGLQPQSVNTLGGYRAQGRDEETAAKIMNDARAIERAGAFAIVVEGVAEPLAAAITHALACPVIGIGASAQCDGQILVTEDMLGMIEGTKPKFVKEYALLGLDIEKAVTRYAGEVRARLFPQAQHLYNVPMHGQAAPVPAQPQQSAAQHLPAPQAAVEARPLNIGIIDSATAQPPVVAAPSVPMNPAPANRPAVPEQPRAKAEEAAKPAAKPELTASRAPQAGKDDTAARPFFNTVLRATRRNNS